MNPQQARRAAAKRQYRTFSVAYAANHPLCEVCKDVTAEMIHHRRLRKQGGALSAEVNVLAVCSPCHDHIHLNVEESRSKGHLVASDHPEWHACAQPRKANL